MTNAFTLHIANVESLARDVSNVIVVCSNGQQCQQGEVLRAAQQHSQSHGSKRSATKQTMQHIMHSQPNAQPKRTQTHYTPTTCWPRLERTRARMVAARIYAGSIGLAGMVSEGGCLVWGGGAPGTVCLGRVGALVGAAV